MCNNRVREADMQWSPSAHISFELSVSVTLDVVHSLKYGSIRDDAHYYVDNCVANCSSCSAELPIWKFVDK